MSQRLVGDTSQGETLVEVWAHITLAKLLITKLQPHLTARAALVVLQDVPTVTCSRTYFCPHRLPRGAGGLEAN